MHVTYDAARKLASQSERLEGERNGLPALFAFTDPVRTPDPAALISNLPNGVGVVLRTFGRLDIEQQAGELSALAQSRGLVFLVAADIGLAKRCGAHGVHWPESQLHKALKTRFSGIMTASAHSPSAVRRAARIVNAVFVSTAFPSRSPSAKPALGPHRLASYAARSAIPVYALGGVNTKTVKRLKGLGLSGVAAIEALTG